MPTENLSSVLFNQKRMKVLELLINNPEKEFTLSEIVELSGVSKPTVTEFIDKIYRLGVVERKKHGNAYLISLNRGSSYLEHLEKILELDSKPLLEAANELKEDLVEELEAEIVSVILYGSVARKTPKLDSDIDLLVVVEDQKSSVQNRLRGISKNLGKVKGLKFSTLVMRKEEVDERVETGDEFINTVLEEGKPLYGGEEWLEIQQKTH